MPYRYNNLDIIVGVGMCAILFGALLFVVAASGTFVIFAPAAVVGASEMGSTGLAMLQPALGRAIVDRALLQRETDRMTSTATAEWNRALLDHRSLQLAAGGPLSLILKEAERTAADHEARVQMVMGRYVVNVTGRGIRSGVLSADQYVSDYNSRLIGAAHDLGQRLDREFASTWQATLGRWIVEGVRHYAVREASIQERLGSAIVHLTQAKTTLEQSWAENQYQLGSLMAAVDRSGGKPEAQEVAVMEEPRPVNSAYLDSFAWPSLPFGYTLGAGLALCVMFFAGLLVAGSYREAAAVREAKRESSRWVYRLAS